MSKLAVSMVALVLAGCASTSGWRTLSIDNSSESAFGKSISALNDELPQWRQQILAIALVDIARTGAESAGETEDGSPAYTDENFRSELDGLTYEGVIALADQTGPPISQQYYAGRGSAFANMPYYIPNQGEPLFTADGRSMRDIRPGGQDWPSGADDRGGAVYPNR